jgi:pyruvate,water dikinase
MQPPRTLGSGEPPPAALPPALRDAAPPTAGLDGDILRGEPASRGRYTGRARVFTPGGERPDIERGDILVARNAGQDWTPILPLLGGIVLDEGAVFQHAALVAREYRVPCVLQTREATEVIHDGQRITIDGTEGVVELAPEGGE